jgi:hypothetical protein
MRSILHHEFPLPWTVQERSTCFVVHDKTSQPLAYIHFEEIRSAITDKSAHTRGGTADRGEHRKVAGATA